MEYETMYKVTVLGGNISLMIAAPELVTYENWLPGNRVFVRWGSMHTFLYEDSSITISTEDVPHYEYCDGTLVIEFEKKKEVAR